MEPLTKVHSSDTDSETLHPESLPTGTVHLLRAERVPARHRKLITVRVRGGGESEVFLFEPGETTGDIVIADAVIEEGPEHCVTVLVENRGATPVHLNPGMELGTVTPAEEVAYHELQSLANSDSASRMEPPKVNGRVCVLSPSGERKKQLLDQLDLNLSESEQETLKSHILSYHDVFALNAAELGTTDVTEHTINTGTHPPIRQPPRRMPFALRDNVDKLVGEMLTQRVIEPSSSPWASPVVLVRK